MLSSPNCFDKSAVNLIDYGADTDLLQICSVTTGDSSLFFKEIQLLKEDEMSIPKKSLIVEVSLSSFGTNSCKGVFMMLKKLNELKLLGKKIKINWFFDENDFDMRSAGEDFNEIFNLDIALLERKN